MMPVADRRVASGEIETLVPVVPADAVTRPVAAENLDDLADVTRLAHAMTRDHHEVSGRSGR